MWLSAGVRPRDPTRPPLCRAVLRRGVRPCGVMLRAPAGVLDHRACHRSAQSVTGSVTMA
jgi:hypothetical protein